MFSFIKDLFRSKPEAPSVLLCPHCENPLTGHDEAECRRKMSRRFFFGLCVAPIAVKVLAKIPLPDADTYVVTDVCASTVNRTRNTILTPAMITLEALEVLKGQLTFTRRVNRRYDEMFKIGDTLSIRKPQRFLVA